MQTDGHPGVLRELLGGDRAFAILHRPQSGRSDRLELLTGDAFEALRIQDIPTRESLLFDRTLGHDVVAVIPYRQISERGFECYDDGVPIVGFQVQRAHHVPLDDFLSMPTSGFPGLVGAGFDIDDERYADLVRGIIEDEIGVGAGSNFVIKRSFRATISDYRVGTGLEIFRRLLTSESNAYWTFLCYDGARTVVGASPERHISSDGGVAVMNPISGTYRYPPEGATVGGVLDFLADGKENDELCMVLDEELKTTARVCPLGGRITGPYLEQMAHLAHTEYYIDGRTNLEPLDLLRETIFAPTVTGSPLENACRVIARYEGQGRGYYSGVLALLGRERDGSRRMDSAIVIRSAEIDSEGGLSIGTGATLVRHSDPRAEAAETRSKAAGLLSVLEASDGPRPRAEGVTPVGRLDADTRVRTALAARNDRLGSFWFEPADRRKRRRASLDGLRALVVDAEDTFTSMLGTQLHALGLEIDVVGYQDVTERLAERADLVVAGPGPGDPNNLDDPRIATMAGLIDDVLASDKPLLAVCLSHQLLARRLGLPVRRRVRPNQGKQRTIQLDGRAVTVGFYNAFAAYAETDLIDGPGGPYALDRSVDWEVHALRGSRVCSVQFHAESVLTKEGPRLLADLVELLKPSRTMATSTTRGK